MLLPGGPVLVGAPLGRISHSGVPPNQTGRPAHGVDVISTVGPGSQGAFQGFLGAREDKIHQ